MDCAQEVVRFMAPYTGRAQQHVVCLINKVMDAGQISAISIDQRGCEGAAAQVQPGTSPIYCSICTVRNISEGNWISLCACHC